MNATEQIIIDKAASAHYQAIADIYNEYVRLGNATMEETLKSADDVAGWVNHFNEREFLCVLLSNERPIGWGIIKRYSDREGYRFACETAIYLTESERGKGYGTMIKKFLIEKCRILGYHHMVAKIFAINKASIAYNLKLGYTLVGTQKEIGFRNGQWQDIVIMQLILD